jgi:dienelactone hydrolase
MKKFLLYFLLISFSFLTGFLANSIYRTFRKVPSVITQIKPRTLDKYTIENLAKEPAQPSKIEIGEIVKEDKDFTSYLFSLSFDPTLSGKQLKKVTGLINVPKGDGPFPLIVMFRGYVDQKSYTTGDGTRRAGEYFATNGFATIAPDFLGYGGSDPEAANIFESRFQTYTTAISLLASLKSLAQWDGENIFIWGHSNGGHLALAFLEITGKAYPTVLWAPVSASFPYSILYYLDETEDSGKLIIQKLAEFFELYDPKLYSVTNYYGKIAPETPIQIHQGTADEAVPLNWTNSLAKTLHGLNLKLSYFTYAGADHNLQPAWNQVVARDLAFFRKNLTSK